MGSPSTSQLQKASQGDMTGVQGGAVVRKIHPRYKTKRCKNDLHGHCPYGDDCFYIHASRTSLVMPTMMPPYTSAGPGVVSPVLHHALLQPSSPYMFYTSPMSPDNAVTSMLPEPFLRSPSSEIDDAVRAVASTNKPSGYQRKDHSSGSPTCHYRTKPCRFFHSTGRCAKGNRCNFIHDYTAAPPAGDTETESSYGAPDSASASDSELTVSSDEVDHSDPVSLRAPKGIDDQEHRNYYPISWRVVSGGVMMSGSREICPEFQRGRCNEGLDCKFSHPSAADEEQPIQISEPSVNPYHLDGVSPTSPLHFFSYPHILIQPAPRPVSRRRPSRSQIKNMSRSHRRSGNVIDGETLLQVSPIDNEDNDNQNLAPPSQLAEREFCVRSIPRPLSTPPVITTSATKVVRLFSAESP